MARDRAPSGPPGGAARAGAQRLHAGSADPLGGADGPALGPKARAITDRILLSAGKTVWANLDVQNAVVIDSYRREAARMQRQDLQRQQTLLDALLEGRGADPEFAAEARSALDIDAGGRRGLRGRARPRRAG